MTEPERGSEPERATLEHIGAHRGSNRKAARTLGRIRLLRLILMLLASGLSLLVGWEIWIHRPPPRTPSAKPAVDLSDADALQSIQKFEFTSTLSGKRNYTIVADRLTGVSGGLHRLEGVRSIELVKPDGKTLKGSSDRGSFQESDGSGKLTGQGLVVLEGHVRVTGEEGEFFESDRIEFQQEKKILTSPGPCSFSLSPPAGSPATARGASGRSGRLEYDLDKKTAKLSSGVAVAMHQAGQPDTVLHSTSADVADGGASAEFTGQVEVTRGPDRLTAPTIHVDRSADGETMHLLAAPHGEGTIVSGREALPAHFAADSIDATDLGTAGGKTIHLVGTASIREAPAPGAPSGRSLEAREITIREQGMPPVRTVHAEGKVVALLPAGPGETSPRKLTCAVLDAAMAPTGGLQEANATGEMRFVAGDTTAEAQRARFIGETRVELRGGRPEIREPERTLIADEIDVVTEPRQVTGRGSARTRFVPTRTQAGPFASGEPVQVASAQALLREKPRGAEFTGGVIARQNERALSSQSLVLEDAEKSAHAEGSVSLRSFRSESSGAKPPIAPLKIPVQIDSDRMVYSDATKTSRFDGHALYREPLHRLSADSIATTGESSDHPSEITAEGNVRFEGEGRTGRSDAAVYRSEQKTIVLMGKTQPAEVRETATGRTWQGPALTCVLTADSIPVVTGNLGRSKIFGTVAEPGREQVGQPTHRRTPR